MGAHMAPDPTIILYKCPYSGSSFGDQGFGSSVDLDREIDEVWGVGIKYERYIK